VVVGDNDTPPSIDRSFRQKINKETLELNETIDQMDLTDVYRVSLQQYHSMHSSQQPMEVSPK
jgi:hypothetical protein